MMDRKLARIKAQRLVSQMTIAEKVSQLSYHAKAVDRLGVPAYNWWNEALHGVARAGTATVFPQAIGMAAMFDRTLQKRAATAYGIEARARYNALSQKGDRDIYKGLTFFSPNINIFRDPRWGRGHETLGEDPFLTAELGYAYITGLQGDGEHMLAAACAKHYAVHSGPENIRHQFNATCSEKDLMETYLPAFETAVVQANVESVMGAYNRFNGEPCCGSRRLLLDILRKQWKFEGFVVSDCWALLDFHLHHMVTATPEESVALAMECGCDLNCGSLYESLLDAYEKGYVTERQIDASVERLFTTRYLLGIMGDGCEYDKIGYETVECPAHINLSYECALRSCVLLKNDGLLPLDQTKLKTVGVIGPNANSRRSLVGNYHGTASSYITVLEGIQHAVGAKVRVLYSQGSDIVKDRDEPLATADDRLAEAVVVAEHSDTVVLVVGLDEFLEGEAPDDGNSMEAGDKSDLLLPLAQRKLIDGVLAVGKPTVIVLLAGSSIDLEAAQDKANALLLGWYPGAQGGRAIADLLFGHASPSGKLPITFYHNHDLARMPEFTDYAMDNRTYRYFSGRPLYPFGYGLTYGDVKVIDAKVGVVGDSDEFTVEITAKNCGAMATEDVIECYIKGDSPFASAYPSLCGFERVRLNPDETRTVTVNFSKTCLTVINDAGQRVSGGARFDFYVGTCQPDAYSRALAQSEPVHLELFF